MPDFYRRIATSTATRLALWDPAVSLRLAREDIRRILEPVEMLKQIANERGWLGQDCSQPKASWHTGAQCLFEGKERTHSAFLALNDPNNELRRRLWGAQVEVIFPLIEERRQELIETLARILQERKITDLQDMEIGEIELAIFRRSNRVPYELRREVRRLKEMRNSLAHLEPLSAESILGNDIKDIPR